MKIVWDEQMVDNCQMKPDSAISRRVFCVLGMHRAGAQAVARALTVLGVAFDGDRSGPLSSRFFENREIIGINNQLLDAIASYESIPEVMAEEELCKHEGLLSRAVQILEKQTSRFPLWGFTDQHASCLLPFWQKAFDHMDMAVDYVISLRDPAGVVRSAHDHNLPRPWSLIVWLRHYASAFLHTERMPKVVVDYDLLLGNPKEQLRRMATLLTLAFDEHSAGIQDFCEDIADPGISHSSLLEEGTEKSTPMFIHALALYERALRMAKDENAETSGEASLLDEGLSKAINISLKSYSSRFEYVVESMYEQVDILRSRVESLEQSSSIVSRMLTFFSLPRGRILMSLRLLPRWMKRLSDTSGKNRLRIVPAAKLPGWFERTSSFFIQRLYSLTLPSGVEYQQPRDQKEATSKFTIIVPIHDAIDALSRCLLSLEHYAPHAEVILVDDGSQMEGTKDLIRDYASRNSWRVVTHTKALGHSRACESGARKATRKYLCLLNSDTVVTPWSWSAVLEAFETDSTIGIAGPATSCAFGPQQIKIASICRHFWTDDQINAFALRYMAGLPQRAWVELQDFVVGFAFFISRSLWEELGGFDIGLPNHGNELDLCLRAKKAGYRLVWVKNSYIHHFGGRSFSNAVESESQQGIRKGRRFTAKRWGVS